APGGGGNPRPPPAGRGELRRRGTGVASPNLNIPSIGAIEFHPPPLAEQSAIVEIVNEKLSQIDNLEAEVDRGLARAARLRQAILKSAFEGRLVPQDPNDEPASALLERLRRAQSEQIPRRARVRERNAQGTAR
ncbi:MAG TPA: hypothetical protein PKC18_21620, partial [Lacipirellulaceae bacterium]|nr:hypothetical protein [Lacipirellulaceae bacterium]